MSDSEHYPGEVDSIVSDTRAYPIDRSAPIPPNKVLCHSRGQVPTEPRHDPPCTAGPDRRCSAGWSVPRSHWVLYS